MCNVDESVNKCSRKYSCIPFTSWRYEINVNRIGDMLERQFCSACMFTVIHRYLKTRVRYLRKHSSGWNITSGASACDCHYFVRSSRMIRVNFNVIVERTQLISWLTPLPCNSLSWKLLSFSQLRNLFSLLSCLHSAIFTCWEHIFKYRL
jgi:hypothetical protein